MPDGEPQHNGNADAEHAPGKDPGFGKPKPKLHPVRHVILLLLAQYAETKIRTIATLLIKKRPFCVAERPQVMDVALSA